jgi:leader peptidase (prepilin peptidase)/N-methyltransferase
LTSFGPWIWPVFLAPFIGSFLGVIVIRADSPSSIVLGRSSCVSCRIRLNPRELIPFLSWLAMRGRCRSCGQPIGAFYPLIEAAAFLIALWSAWLFTGPLLWVSCLFGWTLLALAATDLKYYLLPDFLTLPLIPVGLLVGWAIDSSTVLAHGIGALAGCAFVIALRLVYQRVRGREGMGLGDAKLLAASGAWLSWQAMPSVLLLSALAGLVFALVSAMRGVTVTLTNRVPFGTFLCLGTWLVWLYGPLTTG